VIFLFNRKQYDRQSDIFCGENPGLESGEEQSILFDQMGG
jgi:hypothetical protein